MKKQLLICALIGLLAVILLSCQSNEVEYQADDHNKLEEYNTVLKDEPLKKQKIQLAAVGDLLIHDRVYNDAKTSEGYDFMPMLENVKSYLTRPTITTANQETMIGGTGIGLSSYPRFNSPVEVGDALKEMGVDIVSLANNHTLDRGEQAIQRAISHWNKINMPYVGAYQSQADSEKIRVIQTEEDISLSFLSYTYGTNGIPAPNGKEYLVNRIDRKKIAEDVQEADKISDVIVLQLHFGNEYERMPSQSQKELVQYIADLGVDVIFGHHPHVLQPVEWVEGVNGNRTFVAYSLGNFLSGQESFYRRIGGMVQLTIEKKGNENGEAIIELTEPKFLPTFVDLDINSNSDYYVFPMYQLNDDVRRQFYWRRILTF